LLRSKHPRFQALSSLAALLFLSTANASFANQSVLFVKQLHREFGQANLYLSKRAIRVESPSLQVVYLAKAPDWKVFIFSKERGVYTDDAFAHWIARGVRPTAVTQSDLSDVPVTEGPHKKLFGYDATEYSLVVTKESKKNEFGLLEKGLVNTISSGKYIVANGTDLPNQQYRFLTHFYNLPFEKGLPLECEIMHKNGGLPSRLLNTDSLSTISVPDNFYDLPSGLRRVTDERKVALSDKKIKQLTDFMQDLGVGENYSKTNSSPKP
jgi:hypothetical protein